MASASVVQRNHVMRKVGADPEPSPMKMLSDPGAGELPHLADGSLRMAK